MRLKSFEIWKNKHTFYVNNHSQNIFPVSEQNSVFSLSGKSKNQIPCFSRAVAPWREISTYATNLVISYTKHLYNLKMNDTNGMLTLTETQSDTEK